MTLFYSLILSGAVFFVICLLIYTASRKGPFSLLDGPKAAKGALVFVCVACITLVVGDFLVHKHDHIALGNAPLFYPIFSFLSCLVMLVIAKLCRALFNRDEDYYETPKDVVR